jgi:biopolymer transport protein ExbB
MNTPATPGLDFAQLWTQGDAVSKTVAALLLLMSLASWSVIVFKTLELWRHKRLAQRSEGFWHSSEFGLGLQRLGSEQANPFFELAIEGREAVAHHRQTTSPNAPTALASESRSTNGQGPTPLSHPHLHDTLDLSDWVTRCLRNAIDASSARMQSGLGLLASVGSTAPFVGLFGTVWGIYHALLGIGRSGQASIDQVAGPIGEALVMTALGLAVAIPAVLGYNALVRGQKLVNSKLHRFAHDLHAYFVTGARVASREAQVAQLKRA